MSEEKTNSDKDKELEYHIIKPLLRSFDLLIFHHPSILSKIVIEAQSLATNMEICSHVGIVLTDEIELKGVDMSSPKILESTVPLRSDPFDLESGKYKTGVQLRDLGDVVKSYINSGGKVGVCRLKKNPLDINKEETIKKFKEIYNEYKSYEYGNIQNLIGAVFPCCRQQRDTINDFVASKKEVFCSQFVSIIYISVGIINDETDGKKDGIILDPKNVIPTDFIGNDTDGMVSFVEKPIWIIIEKEK